MIGSALLAVLLVALWVAAWLRWVFDGEVRHFLFGKVFPTSWRGGREADDILLLSRDEFEMYLAAESSAPAFVRGVLGCPECLSAHIAIPGTVLAGVALLSALPLLSLLCLLPLVWAGGAWIGHRAHNYL